MEHSKIVILCPVKISVVLCNREGEVELMQLLIYSAVLLTISIIAMNHILKIKTEELERKIGMSNSGRVQKLYP